MSYTYSIASTETSIVFPVTEWDMAVRPAKIEMLDENKQSLNVIATGFFYTHQDQDDLFTCWHVVTGYNFLTMEVRRPPERKFIRVTWKWIERRPDGHASFGIPESFVIPLYNEAGIPLWKQQEETQEQADLAGLNILVPRHVDMVAIPITIPQEDRRFRCYVEGHVSAVGMQNGQEVVITGFPWGYSALGKTSPEPIFLSRHIASWVLENPQNILLDGVGARGMSGSPVFCRVEDRLQLIGIYSGSYHPDVQATGRPQDSYSSLGIVVRFGSRYFFKF